MNIPLIVLLVMNYWYSIHFTYLYCSYTKNIMKYLRKSSKSLIEGAFSLTSTKDLQQIPVRGNITYPINYKPRFHNILRDARCLDSSIIITKIGKNNCLCRANFDLIDFWALPEIFYRPMKYFLMRHTSFSKST